MIDNQLIALGIDIKWLEPLNNTFAKYDINTVARQSAFIGQCQLESSNFKTLEENLHYSAQSLMRVWSSRFPTLEIASQYANNPEKIANKVYAGRMGNTEDGDGWKYHGRGLIQLTGKENYANCGSGLGIDLLSNPALLATPEYAALSAGWFWNKKGLNALADQGTEEAYKEMTRRINGGYLGLAERIANIQKARSILT